MRCHHCNKECMTAYYCHGHWHCYGCLMADIANSHKETSTDHMMNTSEENPVITAYAVGAS